jgi:predicted tellurium resistance membrane protein TerC
MIDLGWLGQLAFTWEFLAAVMSIVLVDLVLAGDNAVVIAMAVKNLPSKTRQWGIILGAGGAVVIRVLCTFLVAQLLTMSFVKLIGMAMIILPGPAFVVIPAGLMILGTEFIWARNLMVSIKTKLKYQFEAGDGNSSKETRRGVLLVGWWPGRSQGVS